MKKKVLLVDDKSEFRQLLSIILNSKFKINTAGNGLEALTLLKCGYQPDIIISDLSMPKVDGTDLLLQLKADIAYRDIPVIILSSNDDSSNKVKLLRSGAVDYLEKPFNPAELEVRIERVFAR